MSKKVFKGLPRRQFMRQVLGAAGCIPLTGFAATLAEAQQDKATPAPATQPGSLSKEDDQFLDELEKNTFQYFWDQANPKTGLVKDRCNVRSENDTNVVGSIASTGFGLTALCIGTNRGYIQKPAAVERVLITLRNLWGKLPNHRGFFY